jgi:hypothetical protein
MFAPTLDERFFDYRVINSSNDIYTYIENSPDYNVTMEPDCESPLADTSEQMTLEQNNFASTIVVLDDDKQTIWKNGN